MISFVFHLGARGQEDDHCPFKLPDVTCSLAIVQLFSSMGKQWVRVPKGYILCVSKCR